MADFELNDIYFGKIINDLLANPDLTDIEIRPNLNDSKYDFSIWIVDVKKGRRRLDLYNYHEDFILELHDVVTKISRQLAIRMEVSYNEGNAILDAEAEFENKYLLRINSIHESLTNSSSIPLLAIRKASYHLSITKNRLLESGYCTNKFFDLMEVLIHANANIMISGQTGAGKTSILKYLCRYIKNSESIITIEDTREAFLELIYPNKDIGSLKSSKDYNFESLVKTSLRQNMDWLLVSEIRGREVIDLLDAVGSGHYLISTIHSDGVKNIPYRMANMSKTALGESERIYKQVFNDIDIGIYINYYNDENGSFRQIQELCEYYIDEKGKEICHLIYWYDYDEDEYKIDKIHSSKLINKIKRKRIDYSKIKEFI